MLNIRALGEYYLEPYFEPCSKLEPFLSWYVPWSFPCYFLLLLTTYLFKKFIGGPKFVIGANLQFAHNLFLVAQSAFLVYLIQNIYFDTADRINAQKVGKYQADGSNDPFSFFGFVEAALESPLRYENKWFDIGLVFFLFSKLYEQVDTVILIINEKPLIMLHVWHHATTYMAFYVGQFTGAACWIGWWNSFIHVIMYLYYAKVPGMKHIAKYITSLQLFHLFGGALTNFYTIVYPITIPASGGTASKYAAFVDVRRYSIFNAFICLSYFTFFLAFYSRKYDKSGKGSIWSLVGFPKSFQKMMFKAQRLVLSPGKVETYLVNQGIIIPEIAVMDKKKE
jgi:hypothetical protein